MKKIISKVKNIIVRGIVTLMEGEGYQVTLLNGEVRSKMEHLQEFGMASKKPDGMDGRGICTFYGGNRGNGSLLVMEFPDLKPELLAGESGFFNAFDCLMKMNNLGEITTTNGVGAYEKLNAAGIQELNGTVNEGIVKIIELTAKLNEFQAIYNSHVHGSSPTPSPIQPAFVKGDYENTKVVH